MASSQTLTLSVVQMISVIDDSSVEQALAQNFARVRALVAKAAGQGADIVVLPENVLTFGTRCRFSLEQQQNWLAQFSRLAGDHNIWLVAGSLPLSGFTAQPAAAPSDIQWQQSDDLPYATCVVFDAEGRVQGWYRKMHLFDATVADKTGRYTESAFFKAGSKPGLVTTPWGVMGIGICYDLRFPEYFRLLRAGNARFVVLPAAFTHATGAAHWEVLMRARAVENQLYIAGSNQGGQHTSTRVTWGDSMIIDAWGQVVERVGSALTEPDSQLGESVISAVLDFAAQETIRSNMPQRSCISVSADYVK